MTTFPSKRLRRLRVNENIRNLVQEVRLSTNDLVCPIFVEEGLKEKKSVATLTATHPPERFGVLNLSGDYVTEFHEKHSGESSWINGGFFVFEPKIFDYLEDDSTVLEKTPLETLAKEQQLTAFKHNGFWHPMDTLRDKNHLEKLWASGNTPWKIW